MKQLFLFFLTFVAMTIAQPVQAGQRFNVNGLQMEIVNCTPYADGVVVNVTFLNSTGRDVAFKVNNYFEDQCFVIDQDGDQQQLTEFIIGGQGAAGSDFRPIPQDVTMKGQIYFRHVSERHSVVKRMKLFCRVAKDGSEEKEQNIEAVNIPITPLSNTNMEGSRFTDPIVTMNTKGAMHYGKNVALDFSLTNNGKDRYDAPIKEITAYDEDGNAYQGECSVTRMRLETDLPQKFFISIKNVPQNVKKFTLVRAMFDEWGHKMEWKNIPVQKAPYTTTAGNIRCRLIGVECSQTETILQLEYISGMDGSISLSRNGYIIGDDGKKLKISRVDGVPFSPQQQTIKPGKTYKMTLTFPALAKQVTQFDYIEDESSDWKFYGIKVE